MIGGRARDSAAVEASAAAFRPICYPHEQSSATGGTGDSPVVSGDPPETAARQVARATLSGFAASRLCVKSALRNPQFGATPVFAPPPSRHA